MAASANTLSNDRKPECRNLGRAVSPDADNVRFAGAAPVTVRRCSWLSSRPYMIMGFRGLSTSRRPTVSAAIKGGVPKRLPVAGRAHHQAEPWASLSRSPRRRPMTQGCRFRRSLGCIECTTERLLEADTQQKDFLKRIDDLAGLPRIWKSAKKPEKQPLRTCPSAASVFWLPFESLSPAGSWDPSRGPRIRRQRFSALEVAGPIGYSPSPEGGGTRQNTAVKRHRGRRSVVLENQRFGHPREDFNVAA